MNTKLIKYLASAGALLGVATKSSAVVIYTDLNPDTVLTYDFYNQGNQSYIVDFNSNSDDVVIAMNRGLSFTSPSLYNNWSACGIRVLGSNYNAELVALTQTYGGSWYKWIDNLSYNKIINSQLNFTSYNGQEILGLNSVSIYSMGYFAPPNGFENGIEGFLGVKFKISGNDHFGWVRIERNIYQDTTYSWYKYHELTIKDYAYESVAGAPINAGQTSGGVPDAIANDLENQFDVYSNQNTIFINSELSNYEVLITDVSGKQISSSTNNNGNTKFPISGKGVYIITLISEGEKYSKKIII